MCDHIIYRNCIIEIKFHLWWWNGKPYHKSWQAMGQIDKDIPKIKKWMGV